MLSKIEDLALFSVGRGCAFAGLAITVFMVGLYEEMAISFKAGGILWLLVALVLVLNAWTSPSRPYKSTELWLLLTPEERPQRAIAQRVISSCLREAYLRFALHAASVAVGFLVLAILWSWRAAPPMMIAG